MTYLQALVELGEHVRHDLVVPDHADNSLARDVLVGAALVRGETVRDRYEEEILRLNSAELDEFRSGPLGSGPVRVRCSRVWESQQQSDGTKNFGSLWSGSSQLCAVV